MYVQVKYFAQSTGSAPVLVEEWYAFCTLLFVSSVPTNSPAPFSCCLSRPGPNPRHIVRVALHVAEADLPAAKASIMSFVSCLGESA